MNIKKKSILLIVLIIIILIAIGAGVILFLNNPLANETPKPISNAISQPVEGIVKEDGSVINTKFNYSYVLPTGYLRSDIHFEDDGSLGMESSELIYEDIPRKVNYQVGGINIDVYTTDKLVNDNLKDWIQSKTESSFTGEKLYVTNEIKSLKVDELYILISENPLLGGFKNPALFIKNGGHIYVIYQNLNDDTYNIFMKVISSLKIGNALSEKELNSINNYLK
ncbi:MAG: hypothetical protein ACMG57_02775 [Candidatus Dojkabacteria bacterium]